MTDVVEAPTRTPAGDAVSNGSVAAPGAEPGTATAGEPGLGPVSGPGPGFAPGTTPELAPEYPKRAAGDATAPRAVQFTDVVYRYGEHLALDHLDLSVCPGETVALLGPNGAGKSTTIGLILGLLRPTSGTVSVLGRSPHQAMADGRVGAMLQQGQGNGLPPGVRVGAVLELTHQLYRDPPPLEETIARAGIAPFLGRQTQRLSGGQAQRVRFAVAIVGGPELLFLDEPTAAMDVEARREFWAGIQDLADDGRTIVFATHHFDEVEVADRAVVVNHGRIVADGPGATLKAAAATRKVRFVTPDPDPCLLDTIAGVTDAAVRGTGVTLDSLDADATVRDLVEKGVPFADLEVTGHRLEEAFIALCADPAAGTAPAPCPAIGPERAVRTARSGRSARGRRPA